MPSLTSQAVARIRAGLDRPASAAGDPTMQSRLTADFRTGGGPTLQAHMAARTAFVDDAVVAAIEAGVHQVVVVGAGYDDRAWRFRTPGVTFFEVDHPQTQSDKQRRVRALGGEPDVRFVPADLAVDDLGRALADAGQNDSVATLFITEGLLVYLAEETVRRVLTAVRARAGEGSRLVASLAIHADGVDSATAVAAAHARRLAQAADAAVSSAATEPWRTILPRTEHLRLLADTGWAVARETDIPSATGSGGTLLVEAERGPSAEVGLLLWFADQALDRMTAILAELGDERASTRPDLPGANSPYALVTHCCGVLEFWGGQVIANRPIERDRPAEFQATGGVADLLDQVAASRAQLRRDVVAAQWLSAPAGPLDDDDAATPLGQSQGGVLLHVYEELAQHLGHLEITRDVLRAQSGSAS